MFAIRDQENLAHAHQTTAAGKPLNQGLRALQPKTPGNLKTPFRTSRNDENNVFGQKGQKTVLKDGPSKLDKNAFVTPAGPRNRAPLGAKTTNAKGQQLRTPAPMQQTVRKNRPSTAHRSAKSKIVVAPTEDVQAVVHEALIEEDEPDFGYAPPPVAELPDPPMEFGYDETFPQFRQENMFKGYGEIYFGSPKDASGMSIRLKQEEDEYRRFQERQERELAERIARQEYPTLPDPDEEVEAMIVAGPKKEQRTRITESKPDTVKARSAAVALSASSSRVASTVTKQTASSRAKSVMTRTKSCNPDSLITQNRQAPNQVSRNTIGFPKAKKAPSIIPGNQQIRNRQETEAPRSQRDIHPTDFVELYGEPPVGSEMWYKVRQHRREERELHESGIEEDDLAKDFFETEFFALSDENDGEVFQLPMPED